MATIDKLSYTTDVDLGGFSLGVGKMISAADRISRDVQGKLNSIKPASDRVSAGFGSMASSALKLAPAVAAAAVAFKAFDFISEGVKAASDLAETISKVDVVLGEASGAVKAFADDMASQFGLVKGEVLDTAASMGGLGKSLGKLSGGKLSGFSTQFTKLAADLSSIQNIDLKSAADALRIGLSGNQSDKLKELGVITTEAAVKQYALAKGIAKVGQELSEEQKFLARAGVISEGLAFASGDLERTIGGTANAYRRFTGTITNLGAEIGTALSPAINKGIGLLNEFAAAAARAFDDTRPAISRFGETIGREMELATIAMRNWGQSAEIIQLKVGERLSNLLDDFVAWNVNMGVQVVNAGKALAGKAGIDAGPQIKGQFKAQHIDVADRVEELTKKLVERESARADAIRKEAPKVEPGPKVDEAALAATGKLQDWVTGLLDKSLSPLEEYGRDVQKLQDALKQGLVSQEQYSKLAGKLLQDSPLGKFAEHFKEATTTPLEKFRAVLEQGRAAFRAGLIDQKGLDRLGGFAAKEAGLGQDAASKLDESKFAGAEEVGTKEGYSSVVRALSGRGNDQAEVARSGKATAANTGQLVAEFRALKKELAGNKPAAMVF